MNMKPTLLIVEDEEPIRIDLKETFANPPADFKQQYGIDGFLVSTADRAEAAVEDLRAARAITPYDVLLLDLGLPEKRESGEFNNYEVGIRLLQKEVNEGACTNVVVASAHGDKTAVLVELIRTRAVFDFVQKPWDRRNQQVFDSVMQAFFRGQHRLWQDVRRQRFEGWLLVQACVQVADRMARAVSTGLENVLTQAETLRDRIDCHIPEKLTHSHPLMQYFNRIQFAINHTKSECARTRGSVSPSARRLEKVALGPIVEEALQELRPGFITKELTPIGPAAAQLSVHTLRADLKTVIKEIVFSAIEASPDRGRIRIQVKEEAQRKTIDVSVVDEGSPLNEDMCRRISRGDLVEREEERAWALSLAGRMARNMGARIEPVATEAGNLVSLRIPVTIYDQPSGGR